MDRLETKKFLKRAASKLRDIADGVEGAPPLMSVDEWLRVRAEIGRLTAEFNSHLNQVDRLFDLTAGSEKILKYLQLCVGQTVTKEELRGVSGIQEGARRVRELREDHGWPIHSTTTRPHMRVGEYVLTSLHADPDLVSSWAHAKAARKLKQNGVALPAKQRVMSFLRNTYPKAVEFDQLVHVVGGESGVGPTLETLKADGWKIEVMGPEHATVPNGARLISLSPREPN